jgi:hypothetical protein
VRIIPLNECDWIYEGPDVEQNRSDALMRLVDCEAMRLWRKAIQFDMFVRVEAIGCAWANRRSLLSRATAVSESRIEACAGEC